MAKRTKAQLDSIYADNSSGDISEEDGRDLIDSLLGVHAHLYITGNTTAQTGIGTGYSTLDWANGGGDGEVNGDVSDYANDRIQIGANCDGDHDISFTAAITGTASTEFTLRVAVGGTPVTGIKTVVDIDASSSIVNVAMRGIAALSASDLVTIEVCADAASKSLTVKEASLVVKRFG